MTPDAESDARRKGEHMSEARVSGRALRKLLEQGSPAGGDVGAAIDALEALNTTLHGAADACKREAELRTALAAATATSGESVQALERDIIDAKLRVVAALEEKDAVACDLSRAKKELAAFPGPEAVEGATRTTAARDSPGPAPEDASSPPLSLNGDPGSTMAESDITLSQMTEAEEAKAAATLEKTRVEMARLKELDAELVSVTDRMDTTRKRRQQLSEKLSSAYNEL